MDQKIARLVDALAAIEKNPVIGFGAPGHNQGAAMPTGMRSLLGKRVFQADVLTPKGLDDRTAGKLALQRAQEIATEAWNADFCRFVTGGSTQSLHTAVAAICGPSDTLLVAANSHKAERTYTLAAERNAVIVPVLIDEAWDVDHGVTPDALRTTLAAHPARKASFLSALPTTA